jgi:hypothetical protein
VRAGERGGRRHGPVTAGVAALALVVIVAASLALVLSLRHSSARGKPDGPGEAARLAAARSAAAAWVAGQVSPDSAVACDQQMCGVLARHGFPESSLRVIRPGAPFPATAAVVVGTPVVDQQFGSGLRRHWAPAVLAGFGAGQDRVDVRVVAPHGAGSYETALRADQRLSKTVGGGLVTSRQITAAVTRAMDGGQADARLLIVITALAAQHPIDIVGIGDTFSGTTAGVPLRVAEFAEDDPPGGLSQAAYVKSMVGLLRAQPAQFRPISIKTISAGGKQVLWIEFPAPSPLGLLSPQA